MNHPKISAQNQSEIITYYISARSITISLQEISEAANLPIGWKSDTTPGSLINIETVSAMVLGLGADSLYAFEAGRDPMGYSRESNFFLRSHNVLSAAIEGGSKKGFMAFGPYIQLTPGKYFIEFYLRCPNPTSGLGYVDVQDSDSGIVANSTALYSYYFLPSNKWSRVQLAISIKNPNNKMQFRCWWEPVSNMDISLIRVRSL